jgi:hypothetical protein
MTLLEEYRVRLRRYDDELKIFEQRFGMASATLYEKFEAGNAGDTMDYFEWASLYELREDLVVKLNQLDIVQ